MVGADTTCSDDSDVHALSRMPRCRRWNVPTTGRYRSLRERVNSAFRLTGVIGADYVRCNLERSNSDLGIAGPTSRIPIGMRSGAKRAGDIPP